MFLFVVGWRSRPDRLHFSVSLRKMKKPRDEQ
jgi:hypothetical protein